MDDSWLHSKPRSVSHKDLAVIAMHHKLQPALKAKTQRAIEPNSRLLTPTRSFLQKVILSRDNTPTRSRTPQPERSSAPYDRLIHNMTTTDTIHKIVPRIRKTVEFKNQRTDQKIIKLVSVKQSSPKDAPKYDDWDNTVLNQIVSEETRYSPVDKDVLPMSSSSSPGRSKSADLKRSPRREDDLNSEPSHPTYLKKMINNIKQNSKSRNSPADDFVYFKIEKDSFVWGKWNSIIQRKFNIHRRFLLDVLLNCIKDSSEICTNKKIKRIPRPPRKEVHMYKEMSYRIDEYIFKYLIIRGIQHSKPLAIPSPQLQGSEWVPSNYLKSELLIMDMLIHLFKIHDEPFNQHIEMLNSNAKRLREELKSNTVGPDKLKLYAEIIPVLIFNNNAYEAQYLLMEAKLQFPKEIQYWNLWQGFMVIEASLNDNKKFDDCECLLSENTRLNDTLKQVQKIGLVYNTYLKLIWRKSSRAAKTAKSLNLGEWENIIVADLYMREGGSLADAQAIKLLLLCMECKPNIRFLSFVRLSNYYRSKAIVTKPSMITSSFQ